MSEPCPPHLDEEGRGLWLQCEWIIEAGKVDPSFPLQLQALYIRRELRQESVVTGLRQRISALENELRRAASEASDEERFGELVYAYVMPLLKGA